MSTEDRVPELEQETARRVLAVVLREMVAYGRGWRADWSDFDGRILQSQLEWLADWAGKALIGRAEPDYTYGTRFKLDRESWRRD